MSTCPVVTFHFFKAVYLVLLVGDRATGPRECLKLPSGDAQMNGWPKSWTNNFFKHWIQIHAWKKVHNPQWLANNQQLPHYLLQIQLWTWTKGSLFLTTLPRTKHEFPIIVFWFRFQNPNTCNRYTPHKHFPNIIKWTNANWCTHPWINPSEKFKKSKPTTVSENIITSNIPKNSPRNHSNNMYNMYNM